MTMIKLMRRFQFPRVAVLCFLLILVAIGAVPGYLTGHWPWAHPTAIVNLNQIRNLRKTGLTLAGWPTKEQHGEIIGGHKWSIQEFQKDSEKPLIMLLRPQQDPKDQPEVEWMDINGFEQQQADWQTDSDRILKFTVEASPTAKVEASFFRAWNQQQTYAVLQWYAWSEGGHFSPVSWFWADQNAQWQHRRLPWVAVSIRIPIEPLGNIETVRPLAASLGKTVQARLMQEF